MKTICFTLLLLVVIANSGQAKVSKRGTAGTVMKSTKSTMRPASTTMSRRTFKPVTKRPTTMIKHTFKPVTKRPTTMVKRTFKPVTKRPTTPMTLRPPSVLCNNTIAGRSGIFVSPYYPQKYHAFRCHGQIRVPQNMGIEITFLQFDFGSKTLSGNCNNDYVRIRDFSHMTTPKIYCGQHARTYRIMSNQAVVDMMASTNGRYHGFKATYQAFSLRQFTTASPPRSTMTGGYVVGTQIVYDTGRCRKVQIEMRYGSTIYYKYVTKCYGILGLTRAGGIAVIAGLILLCLLSAGGGYRYYRYRSLSYRRPGAAYRML